MIFSYCTKKEHGEGTRINKGGAKYKFKMKGKPEYAKLDTYVYGPLASSGEAIATYSSLINNNLMNPIQLKMDRASMEGSKSDQPPYEPLCKFGLKGETDGVTPGVGGSSCALSVDTREYGFGAP